MTRFWLDISIGLVFSITRDIDPTDETFGLDNEKLVALTRERLSIESDMDDDQVELIMRKIIAAINDELVSSIIIFYFPSFRVLILFKLP